MAFSGQAFCFLTAVLASRIALEYHTCFVYPGTDKESLQTNQATR